MGSSDLLYDTNTHIKQTSHTKTNVKPHTVTNLPQLRATKNVYPVLCRIDHGDTHCNSNFAVDLKTT